MKFIENFIQKRMFKEIHRKVTSSAWRMYGDSNDLFPYLKHFPNLTSEMVLDAYGDVSSFYQNPKSCLWSDTKNTLYLLTDNWFHFYPDDKYGKHHELEQFYLKHKKRIKLVTISNYHIQFKKLIFKDDDVFTMALLQFT